RLRRTARIETGRPEIRSACDAHDTKWGSPEQVTPWRARHAVARHRVASRYTFKAMITAVTKPAVSILSRRSTSEPISFRLLVKNSSGTSANGMPKERKTWLRTRALVLSKPTPIRIKAGIIVIARRA